MNEFLEQFLIEARELIEQATQDLLALEHEPADRARLDSAFRAFHTVKGGAGIVDFAAMATLAHAVEDMLAGARTGTRPFSKRRIDLCLRGLDQMTLWLNAAAALEAVPLDADAAADRLVAEFLAQAGQDSASAPALAVDPPAAAGAHHEAPPGQVALPPSAVAVLKAQADLLGLPADAGSAGRNGAAVTVIDNVLRRFGLHPSASEAGGLAAPPEGLASGGPAPEGLAPGGGKPADAKTEAPRAPRVDMARIDGIVKLAGELTVAKNALGHAVDSSTAGDPEQARQRLRASYAQLERLTSELLQAALGARVLPLRQVFQRFPRLVRDMAESLGKPVRLVTQGEATEADKAVVEALFQPILHLLRNAVDHGIEPPARRAAAGKPNPAIIRLTASRESAQVIIEIADDGRGMDVAAIRDLAVRRGLITSEAAAALPEAAILRLIFMPGFSTASEVTELSGRGVGMDAVRTAIEQLGGRIGIETRRDAGTTIRLILPFTVMLTKVITVEAGGQMFGVPFDAVVETRQIPVGDVFGIGAARAVSHRGGTIPLIDLASGLKIARQPPGDGPVHAVIVDYLGESAAIEVDRFGGQSNVILKPLEGLLTGMPGIAGTTVLGDGRVLIVLELYELLK